ncbi:MAG: hypothetical protein RLZZ373_2330 [Pseudomonadota bacterium]
MTRLSRCGRHGRTRAHVLRLGRDHVQVGAQPGPPRRLQHRRPAAVRSAVEPLVQARCAEVQPAGRHRAEVKITRHQPRIGALVMEEGAPPGGEVGHHVGLRGGVGVEAAQAGGVDAVPGADFAQLPPRLVLADRAHAPQRQRRIQPRQIDRDVVRRAAAVAGLHGDGGQRLLLRPATDRAVDIDHPAAGAGDAVARGDDREQVGREHVARV